MDTVYGRRWIRRIGNCEYVFSCEDLALIRRIPFPGYGVLEQYKKDRILQTSSNNKRKNKVEDQPRIAKSSLNNMTRVSKTVCNANVKHSVLNANSELICATCHECMFDAIHDLCVSDYLNDVNARVKSRYAKSKKKKMWKPTSKVYTIVGYSCKPTGRIFTIDENTCPLTRIISTKVVPPRKSISTTLVKQTQPSSNKSRKLKDITNVGSGSKSKTVEAVSTACYTQNRSLIRLRYNKTPYELMHEKKPDLSFLHVFGSLCYPTNDSEDLGKLKPKADISIFVVYAPPKKAYRIYNKRTRQIMETIHVTFDELTVMASKQFGSGLAPQLMTPGTLSS
ncbi:retrovirus-related pol polyprotein from transposon TNT 1-94 [Tanacetum coccineum]